MAFKLAAAPAAQRRAWVVGIAAATVFLALAAAAAGGFWTPSGRGISALGGGVNLHSGSLRASWQPEDVAAAGQLDVSAQQQQLHGGVRQTQHMRGQAGAQPGNAAAAAAAAGPQHPPLCGGASSVRRVADSLAASRQALVEGLEEDFQPYEQGFGLEDVDATATYLQADAEQGHVHAVIEVRCEQGKTIVACMRAAWHAALG